MNQKLRTLIILGCLLSLSACIPFNNLQDDAKSAEQFGQLENNSVDDQDQQLVTGESENNNDDYPIVHPKIVGSNLYEVDGEFFLDLVAKNPTNEYLFSPNFNFKLPDLNYGCSAGSLVNTVPPNAYFSNNINLSRLTDIPENWNGNYVFEGVDAWYLQDPSNQDMWINSFYPYLEISNVRHCDDKPEKFICFEVQNIGSETYNPTGSWGLRIAYMFFDKNNNVLSVGTANTDHRTKQIAPQEIISTFAYYERLPFHDRIDHIEAIAIGHLDW